MGKGTGWPRAAALLAPLLWLVGGCVTAVPLGEGDRDLMFSVHDLRPYGLALEGEVTRFESRKKSRWSNGTIEVEYHFDASEARSDLPFVYSLAELHPSAQQACASFRAGNAGIWLAADAEDRNEIFQYGDETRFAFLRDGAARIGMVFSMCRSRTSYLLMLGGFYFDDSALFRSAIMPKLEALRRLEEGG